MTVARIEVTVTGPSALSAPAMNVWHLNQATSNWNTANANNAIVDMAAFYTAVAALYPNSASIRVGSRVVVLLSGPDEVISATAVTVTGTGGSGALPPQCSTVVSLRTALAGPRYRGRLYLGPMAAAAIDANGRLTSALQTTIQNAYATLLGNLAANAEPQVPVVYSRKFETSQIINGGAVDTSVDTQRRRA